LWEQACCNILLALFYSVFMKRILTILLGIFLLCASIASMPAYPRKIAVLINGQKHLIYLFGDEHSKRAETEDGYTIIQNEQQQWCYAKTSIDSTIVPSSWTLGSDKADEEFVGFLETIPKHLKSKKINKKEEPAIRKNSKKAVGQRRILVILMSYQDLAFRKSRLEYESLFNEEGYNVDDAQGSVRDFYLAASYHKLQLESDIYGPYTASHNMAYYGKNSGGNNGQDVNAYSLFEEAITNVAQDVDLSIYDGDDDGYIDNVHIIFAGYGEEAGALSDAIWSHEATFYRPYEIQGLKIDRYSCAPELRGNSGNGISRIGPHCHEIGHALGAMDYYDTNYSTGGEYLGTGKWDVMASGSWNNDGITPADFNPYVKAYNYGWITPKALPTGSVTISPSCADEEGYYILKSTEYGDYYLLENRNKEKWGVGIPGEGLLLFHIHSNISNGGNEINATAPQMCYVVCASSRYSLPSNNPASYGDINSDGCPFPGSSGNTDFGQNSIPKAFYWNNDDCGIELNDISFNSDKNITLINNSYGADYEPREMKSLFFEGFEEENSIKVQGIEQSAWKIVDNPDNKASFIDKPVAYEGTKSLQLSAKETGTETIDSLFFSCMPMNNLKMRVKISVASLHLSFNKPNIVNIGYRTNDNSDWQYAEILSSENNRWNLAYIDLPSHVDTHFKIVGTVYGGSVLAIDNVEVEQEVDKQETEIRPTSFRITQDTGYSYYSLDGIKHKKPHKGINIINRDGKIIKIVY